jgi:hypothetical protein
LREATFALWLIVAFCVLMGATRGAHWFVLAALLGIPVLVLAIRGSRVMAGFIIFEGVALLAFIAVTIVSGTGVSVIGLLFAAAILVLGRRSHRASSVINPSFRWTAEPAEAEGADAHPSSQEGV